jgi:rare lipoprotein A
MARAGLRFTIFGLAAAGLLMGCVEGGGSSKASDGSALAGTPAKKKGGARDVEAPEIFQATDSALWDGRPSLGGIWVAAPDVTNPERALIFNPATGKSVTGALFKRERENPGPRLQLSSDAAEALGILAGQPTEIRVTALRKVEDEVAAEPEADAAAAGAAAAGTEGAAATDPAKKDSGEAAAIASAALAAVDAKKPAADPGAEPAESAAPAAAAVAGAAAVAADGAAAVVDEKPKRKTWKERRAEAKAAREAKKRAAAEAAAAASAAEADAAMAAGEVPAATAESAAVAPIESAPLDARDPNAVAAKPDRASKRKTVGAAPAPAAEAPAGKAADANDAPVATGGPVRPIQVASFSKEDNAKRAAEALAKIGVTATPQKSEKAGKAVWGVIVQGDEAMLKKIKDAGFADAYFLK